MQNNTIPLIPSTSDLNAKLMDIVGQYDSIETSYLRVISSIYNENVQLKEENTELTKRIKEQGTAQDHTKRIEELEEEKVGLLKRIHEEEQEQETFKRVRLEVDETNEIEELKQKNAMLGREIHAKNTKLQNQTKQLKEYMDIIAKFREKENK